MERNIPRAAIHVGTDKKTFSSQVGNEAERRGWDEKRYQLKNADIDKNNHYNYSRKRLNFEIVNVLFYSVSFYGYPLCRLKGIGYSRWIG